MPENYRNVRYLRRSTRATTHAAYLQRLEDRIAAAGWVVLTIRAEKTRPPYSYSMGLGRQGLPDLIMVGVAEIAGKDCIGELARMLLEGKQLPLNEPIEGVLPAISLILRPVPPAIARDWLLLSSEGAPAGWTVLQVCWPDPEGKFPWEPGSDPRWAPQQPIFDLWDKH